MMDRWSLTDSDGLQIQVLRYGASWVSCRVPLANEAPREVLLGFDDLASQRRNRGYVGATVGRWANRIAGLELRRGGQAWPLASEPGLNHQLHGGPGGFHQRDWTLLEHSEQQLRLGLHSPDGDQGFPGALDVEVRYSLPGHGAVQIDFHARLHGAQACPVGLTNHAYFQLDGRGRGEQTAGEGGLRWQDVRTQTLQLGASQALPLDGSGLPAGAPAPVSGGALDYRTARLIGQPLDQAFVLDSGDMPAARLQSVDGRVALDLYTSLPALQVYTGHYLAPCTQGCHPQWPDFSAVALEPQYLPDSPHHPEWPQPDCWLEPGQVWAHRNRYQFHGR
ncbi:galactose-1-epimerase [Paucibacter sp. DJ1R-11]|uniref:galactose-1-epimerase n=1 Tax=Paucibacter sp. DJ1R-11 TaxID=2893556 RepID=UPI0021E3BBB1|nr:galactose-1-epimerase [Paucibacter sp. DJ1R-11]MCV2364408.1 galactose-1-epimerase [Paucibacter sp. DJ1R-11]